MTLLHNFIHWHYSMGLYIVASELLIIFALIHLRSSYRSPLNTDDKKRARNIFNDEDAPAVSMVDEITRFLDSSDYSPSTQFGALLKKEYESLD